MQGNQHYREAEELTAKAQRSCSRSEAAKLLAGAQVHATLALAAALAAAHNLHGCGANR